MDLKDRKGAENVFVDHSSRIRYDEGKDSLPIDDSFPDDRLFTVVEQHPWYVDYDNYLVGGTLRCKTLFLG